jgi:cytochrome c oxidase subunit 2
MDARTRRIAGLLVLSLLMVGCGGAQTPSALDTAGPSADRVAALWWLLFAISLVVIVVVMACVLWAVARRRGPEVRARPGGGRAVLLAGIVVPAVVLTAVYAIGLNDLRALGPPGAPPPR